MRDGHVWVSLCTINTSRMNFSCLALDCSPQESTPLGPSSQKADFLTLTCALALQYISLDILQTDDFFDLLMFVHRCIICIWAASLTSARPPCSHEDLLAILSWAS